MSDTYGLDELSGTVDVLAVPSPEPGIRTRRGLRVALLSVAALILVVGAAAAGTFGYAVLVKG